MTHRASRMQVLKIRGRRANLLLLAQGRSKGLLLRKGFKDRARAEDMFPFPPAWTHETGLPLEVGILELWDTLVSVISGTFADSVCSSIFHHGPGEPISVPRHCTGPYHFTIRSDGQRHGLRSRSRPRLTSLDFRDPRACLRHHTSDRA